MTDNHPTPDPTRPPVEHRCEADPFSIIGLTALARTDPEGWRRRLRDGPPSELKDELATVMKQVLDGSPPRPGSDDGPTLRQVLLAFSDALYPAPGSSMKVDVVRQSRQLLAAVNEQLGDWPAEFFVRTPQTISQNTHYFQRASGRAPLTPARAQRADALARAALNHWRRVIRASPVVDQPPQTAPSVRPARTTVQLRAVLASLVDATPSERVKIGLAVGAGLSEPQIEALDARDFETCTLAGTAAFDLGLIPGSLMFVRVRDPADGSRVRWVPLPPWLADLVVIAAEAGAGDPFAGAVRLTSTLRRIERGMPQLRLSTTALRVTWQGVMRRAGASHEVVRGSWWQPARGPKAWPERWHRAQADIWRVAREWEFLGSGPGRAFVDGIDKVPAKAPSRCAPHEPELRGRKRRVVGTPLPERLWQGM